jgi:putative membrane protein
MTKITSLDVFAIALVMNGTAHAQTPIPPSPQDFAAAIAQGDHYEIMAGRLAEVQSQDPRVIGFAQKMIRDHTRMSDDIRRAEVASRMPPPAPAMSSDQAMLLSGLQSLRGADFDKAYARQQILAHAQAFAVMQSFASDGADSNLQKAAASALPTVQEHMRAAEALRAEVGGS